MSDPERNESEGGVDEVLFRYLEARDHSPRDAEELLRQARESSADGGAALDSALERLLESGLIEADQEGASFGPYRLERRIARGAMGEVHRAVPVAGGPPVALKLLRPELRGDADSTARFARETEALRRLEHPSIAALLDAGDEDGVPYLAFELVEGVTLDGALRAAKEQGASAHGGADLGLALEAAPPILEGSWADACTRVVREVLRALAHAHGRGVIHRDVKPSNVMLTPEGRAILLDFGLASVEDAARMTREGHRVGSLPYMAPELVRDGGGGSAASDVYAAGVMLAELLLRRLPFEAVDAQRLAVEILAGVPARTGELAPPDLGRVVRCALDPSLALRYPSAEAMAADLTEVLEGRPVQARSPGPWIQLGRWRRRRPVLSTALAAAAIAAIAGPLAFGVVQRAHAQETTRLNVSLEESLAHAETERARATEAADKALFAIEAQLRRVAGLHLEHVPGARAAREAMLDDAEGLLETIPTTEELEPKVRLMGAHVTRTRADLLLDSGDEDAALALYREQLAEVRALRSRGPKSLRLDYELGSNLLQQARILGSAGRVDEAIPLYGEGLPLVRAVVAAGWAEGRARKSLAQALANRAACARLQRDVDLEQELRAEATEVLDGLPPELARETGALLVAVQLAAIDAKDARGRGDWSTVVDVERRRVELLEGGLAEQPFQRTLSLRRASALKRLALALERTGDGAGADQALGRASNSLGVLVGAFPAWADARVSALEIPALRAQLAMRRGDADSAIAHGERGVDQWRDAEALDDHDVGLSMALSNLSNTIIMNGATGEGDLRRAEELASEALDLVDEPGLALPNPWMLCTLRYNRALPRARLGMLDGATADLEAAEADMRGRGVAIPGLVRLFADGWAEVRLGAAGANEATRLAAEERMFALLEEAVELGYADLNEIATNATLDGVRDDPRYRRILGRLR